MNLAYHTRELQKNKVVFKTLFSEIKEGEFLWKSEPNKWNLLEILCHLYDEEREDFRDRVKSVLEDPKRPLPPFDPMLWVSVRNYLKQDYDEKLASFLKERDASVKWLESLENAKWENVYQHPKRGLVSASFFLSNWVAHDYLHIRQILNLKFQYLKQLSEKDLNYAGTW